MDANRFDTLTKSLTSRLTRRAVLKPLGSVAFGGALASLGLARAEASKKHKKKKKKDKPLCGLAGTRCCKGRTCVEGAICNEVGYCMCLGCRVGLGQCGPSCGGKCCVEFVEECCLDTNLNTVSCRVPDPQCGCRPSCGTSCCTYGESCCPQIDLPQPVCRLPGSGCGACEFACGDQCCNYASFNSCCRDKDGEFHCSTVGASC